MNIINVTVKNNSGASRTVSVVDTTTIRTCLEECGIDYTRGMTQLDCAALGAGDLDKTFADFGVTKSCYLLNIVKTNNAR